MAAVSTILLASAAGVSAFGSITGGISQANSLKAQGEIQRSLSQMNSRLADFQAEDALRQGDKAVFSHREQTKQLIGSQRVALAAQGIDIESGSAIEVQDSTKFVSERDVMTIKNNAYRQAWGYKSQALEASFRGEMASLAANSQASNTLLTGVTQGAAYGLQAGFYGTRGMGGGGGRNPQIGTIGNYYGGWASGGGNTYV